MGLFLARLLERIDGTLVAPSAERRAPSAERRAPSAERRAPSAERRAPSAERRAPSAMTAPRAREQSDPPSPPYRLPPRRGGGPSSEATSAGRPASRACAARCGLVRSGLGLAAAACLSLVCALALPASAQAQEVALVSNIGQAHGDYGAANPEQYSGGDESRVAQRFTTGPSTGYSLQSVLLSLTEGLSGGSVVAVKIHRNNSSGNPGSVLTTLANPANPFGFNQRFSAPSPLSLDADTPYWVVVRNTSPNNTSYFQVSVTNSSDQTTTQGFEIGDSRKQGKPGSWIDRTGKPVRMEVRGTLPPLTDATLSALSLGTGVTLVPPLFVSDTYDYTASVVNSVSEVTVTPTTNHAGATVEYLNASDAALADADTAAGHQVALSVGDTVIKVKVTAQDGTSTQTYTVTVTRRAGVPGTCTLNTGDLWCGVVTVGEVKRTLGSSMFTEGYGFTGNDFAADDAGMLSDTTFSLSSNEYTITRILIGVAGLISTEGTLSFGLAGTGGLPSADTANLKLHVGGNSFAFSTAEYVDSRGANIYAWSGSGLDWSSASAVTLRLRQTAVSDPPPKNPPVFSGTTATRTVPENSAAGIAVGAPVTATDTDTGDTLTYSLEGTDAGSFTIDSGTGQIKTKTGVTYDHEATKNSYSVTVKASDGTDSDTIAVTISVTDVAEQPSKPAAPTVSAVPGSATSLAASWSAPGLNGGPALTGYEVQYRAGSGTWMGFGHSGTAVTTTITGLTADTSYQVQVRAKNGETDSDWSDPSAAVRTNDLPKLSVENVSAQEGNSLTFTVTLSPASAATVTVRWAASSLAKAGNDAVAGTDYTAASGTLTFGANETSKQVTVATREDTTDEDDETFTLTLSSPTNAELSNGLTELEALGTIENDDTPPELSVADAAASEGGVVGFTVRLSAVSGKTVTVTAATSIGGTDTAGTDDFTAVSETLTFSPNDRTKTVEVTTDDDALDEEDEETFTLTLSGPSNATLLATASTATGTIRDNDALPRITIGKATVNEGDGTIEVPLTLNTASAREVTAVWYVNTGGSYTAEDEDFAVEPTTPRTVRFPAESVSEQIRIALVDDTTDEPDETFLVQLGGAVNATFANASNTVTIEDNDDPPTISIAADVRQQEMVGTVVLEVNLSEVSEKQVRFSLRQVSRSTDTATAADLNDDSAVEGQDKVIDPGTTAGGATRTYIKDDTLDEDNETFTLEIHDFRNATAGAKTEATVTIEDDDDPPVVSVMAASADEGDPVEFQVELSAMSGKTVTVRAATSVGSGDTAAASDFTAVSETVTFAPGTDSDVVSVATDEDTTDEDNETFTLTLSGESNATLSTTNATAKGTIRDDDDAPVVTLVLTPSSIDEDGGSTAVTATLSNPSIEATTVTVSAVAASPAVAGDFALSTNRTLTIAAGATVSTGTVTIAANDNNVDARDRQVTVSATATNTQDVAGNPDDVTLTIEDDEASPSVTLVLSASSIGEDGGTTVATASLTGPSSEATTVTLTPAPGDWTADGGGRLTIRAGATQSDGSVTLTAVNDDTDAPDKTLTVTATATNDQGVNQPTGAALAIEDDETAPTATLTVSAPEIPENGGTATVSVKLDHASSEPTTVTVTAAGANAKAAAFTLTGATLTVPAGRTAGSSVATLTATENDVDAPDQTVTVSATARNTQGIAGDPADVSLTIPDDEASPTVTLALSAPAIGEAGGEATVTASLSHPSSDETTVAVRAEAVSPAVAGDFTLSTNRTLTIPATTTASTGTVTVTANDNNVDAADKRVTVSAAADNKQGLAGHPSALTLTIEDDDERGLAFSPAARTLSESEVARNAYTVALTSEPTATVTLRVTSPAVTALGVSDASLSPILASWTLTFTPDDWDDPQALSLVAGADADSAPDTVQLRHAASGGDYGSVSENYAVTIADTDAPTRNIVLSVDRVEVPEGGGAQTLEVTARLDAAPLTSPASVAVTVGAGTAEAADFAASPATFNLTIAAGGFSASQTVTLTPVDDTQVEGAETVAVSGTTTTTQEGTTTVLGVTGAEVIIADDDARGVTVAADDPLEVNEDGSATYTVVLDSVPEGEVTVTPKVTGDADVTVEPEVLTFTAATWDTAQRVRVSAADDDDTADDEAEVRHTVAGADYGANNVTADSVTVSVKDDDSQGISVSVSRLTVPEGGSATYTVVLDSAPSGTVTVRPQATGNADVTVSPSSLRFTASNWSEMQTVTVSAREDADSENDAATVSHAVSGAPGLAGRDVAVTVTDDDEASTGIALRLSPETVDEGGGAKTVTVTAALNGAALTVDTDVSVQVRAGTGAGVASATDFTAVPAALVLTIRAGETEARGTFRLTPDDDDLDEGDGETVEVTVSGTPALPVTGAELVIVDDDGRGLEVSRMALTVTEASSAIYTVRLASLPTGPVTVAVAVADNPDVTVRPESLAFSVANWETRQTVTVSAADDPDGDADMATVTHAATGGGYDGITGSDVAVAVRDNDRASRTVQLAVEPATVEEDGGGVQVTVTATLDGAARATATEVALASTGGTATSGADFQALTGLSVTIPANETEGSATVSFTPVDDDLDEGLSETVVLGGTADGLTVRTATLTIADDDGRGIELPAGPVALDEEGDTTYEVVLATQPTGEVTVRVTVSGNRDVTVEPSSLTFDASSWDTEQTVTVSATPDDDAANDEAELRHAASGADYRGVTALPLAVEVTDNDQRGVTVSETALTFREGASATYDVVLDTQPTGTVTVTPSRATGGDLDVTVSPSSLRFTTSNWSRAQTVTVRAGQDLDQDEDRATVEHAVTGADYGEESVTAADVVVTVTDDDVPSTTINLSVTPETVREGARSVRLTVTAELDASPEAQDTVLTLSLRSGTARVSDPAAPGGDFQAVEDVTLTITAGRSDATAQVTLAPVGDDVDEEDETVRLTVTEETVRTGLSLSSSSLEVTIEDDDTRGVTLSRETLSLREAGNTTYTVRLASQPTGPVTVRPSVTPAVPGDPDVTVEPVELTFTADDWGTAQTVTVAAADDADGDDDEWTLAHTLSGGDYGDVTPEVVPVSVSDNDEASRTVTLTVDPVEVQESRGETVTVTAALDGAARSVETEVALAVTGGTAEAGTDFREVDATVTIPAGRTEADGTFFLSPVNDDVDEGDGETVMLGGSTEGLTVRPAELTIVDDDTRGIVVTGGPLTLREEDRGRNYTVRLASAPTGPVTVRVTVSGDRDVTVQPSSLAFSAESWNRPQVVTVTAAHDDDASGDEAELRHAASGADYRGVTGDAVAVTVTDDDTPSVTVSETSIELREGGSGSYTVVLATQPSGTVTVTPSLATSSDEDVTISPSSLRFTTSSWNRPQTVTVRARRDTDEDEDTATVEHEVAGADYADAGVTARSVRVTVTDADMDSTAIALAVSPATVREGAGAASLTVTAELDGAPADAEVAVTLSLVGGTARAGTDFEAGDDVTLTIPAGAVRGTARMTLTPVDDEIDGPDETETVRVTGSANGFTVTPAEVTLVDDDARGLVVSRRTVRVGGNGEATYTVRLATRPSGGADVTVRAALHAPPEVTVAPEDLRFTAGDWNVAQTVTVAAPPGTYRDNETAAVVYTVSGADYGSVAGGEVVVSLTYRAPSPPPRPRVVVALSVDPETVPEGGGAAPVTVTAALQGGARSVPTEVAVAVTGETAEAGTDFAEVPGFTVTIPAGETRATETFTLAPVDDAIDEGDGETVTVAGTGTRLTVHPATLTLTDDDERGLASSLRSLELDDEGVGSYTVALKSQPTGEVTVTPVVTVTPSGPGSGLARATRAGAQANEAVTVTPPALTFTQEDWNVPQTVTVDVPATILGGDETLAITHMVSGADYDDVDDTGPGAPVVVISRPGETRVTLAVSPAEVPEAGGAAEVTVTAVLEGGARSVRTEVVVTVSGETAETGTDFAEVSGFTVTIPAGETQATGTFTFEPVDDALDEGDGETLTVVGTGTRLQVSPATLTLTDNDERGLALSLRSLELDAEGVGSYTVALKSQPTGEVTVTPVVTVTPSGPGSGLARATRADAQANEAVTVTPPALTFTEEDWNVPQTVTVDVPATILGGDETLAITHMVSGADYDDVDDTGPGAPVVVISRPGETRVTLAVSPAEVPEAGGAAEVTVTAVLEGGARSVRTEVVVTVSGETAETGTDFAEVSGFTVTIPAGETQATGTFTFEPVDDALDEGDGETLTVAGTGTRLTVHPATLTLADDDERGLMLPEALTVAEGGTGRYEVSLSSQPAGEVTVGVSVPGDGRLRVTPSSLTFTVDDWNVARTVTVEADEDDEAGRRQVQVRHEASGADYEGVEGAVTVTVVDGAVPATVALEVAPRTVPEGAGATALTVTGTLDAARETPVELTLSLGDGTAQAELDYEPVEEPATLTIPAGELTGTTELVLTPVDDDIDEGDGETVRIEATTADSRVSLVPSSLEVTIADDDERGLEVAPASVRLHGGGEAVYTVVLASRPAGEVTVTPSLSGPAEVTVAPAVLTFTAQDWDTPREVTLSAAEGVAPGTATVTHAASGADYAEVAGGEVTVTLLARAPVRLAVEPAEVPEGGGAAEVTVTAVLEAALETPTEIVVAVSGGTAEAATDFAPVPEFTVSVPAGATEGSGTFELAPVDDAIDEGAGETVTVGGTAPGFAVTAATLTIADDDTRGLEVAPASVRLHGGGEAVYTLVLASRPAGEVTVTPSLSGPAEVTVAPAVLTFTAQDWDTPREVTLSAAEGVADGTATVTHAASGADYAKVAGGEVTVTLLARAPVRLAVEPAEVPEGGGAAEVTVTAVLEAARETPVELTLSVGDGTAQVELDYAPVEEPATLTIPAGELTGTTELVLTPVDDDIDEGDGETVRIEATTADSRVSLVPSSLEVTIADDDERGLMLSMGSVDVDEEGVARWQVSLLSQPTGEVVVSVTAPDAPPRVTVATPSLTFTPSSWSVMQWVTLRVPPGLYRGDESAVVVHTPQGADYSPELRQVVTVSLGRDAVAETVPAAWLSRFGRTVAGQAVDMVGSRLEGGGGPHVRLGGIGRLGDGGTWVEPAHEESTWPGLETPLGAERTLTGRELLLGSSFQWTAGGGEAGAPVWTAWGRFAAGGFEADEERMRMDGDVTGAFLGMDVAHERWLAGLAVAVSEGDGEYELHGGGETGEVESSLSSLYPYARYRLSERVDVWGLAGYGTGTMTVGRDAGETDTDIEMQMGAVGARTKVDAPVAGLSVAVKTDALWLRVSSEEARDAPGGDLDGADARVSRLRLVVEGTHSFEVGGGTLAPTVEVGLRHDGGDAETGAGLEVGAGLGYAGDGFTIEGSVRGLLAHDDSGYKEWGASGALRIEPDASGRGFSLTVAPAWGAASSGMDRLWSLRDTGGLVREDEFEAGSRLETEFGYGLRAPLGAGVLTPYTGLTLSEGGARTGRLGSRWEVAPGAVFGLEASREAGGDDALMLRGRLRW